MGERVLVCGGRDYRDVGRVFAVLDELDRESPISLIIEGGSTGADAMARAWSKKRLLSPSRQYAAEWRRFGNQAGPIRNQRMIDHGKPDLVVAFPGGAGTADMVRRARQAGVRVLEVAPPTAIAQETSGG
jgi:hypothetical protein